MSSGLGHYWVPSLGLAEVAAAGTIEYAALATIGNVECLPHDIDCTCLSF